MSKEELLTLYNEADYSTKRQVWHMAIDGQPEYQPSGRHRDIAKILEEYDNKYGEHTNIYTMELEHLLKRGFDEFDLVTSCIKFGYVLGRRAEKRARYTRNKNK